MQDVVSGRVASPSPLHPEDINVDQAGPMYGVSEPASCPSTPAATSASRYTFGGGDWS